MEQPTKEIQIKKNLVTALAPWFDSLGNPARAQEKLLRHLLLMYGKTDYGKNHGAGKIRSIDEYRTGFPVITYADVAPMKTEIMRGEVGSFLSEPILAWAMTRGTTGRESKFIPVSTSDIADREKYGPRALLNYVYRTGNYRILRGFCMNQTFPSQVGSAPAGTTNVYYGYNSGVYARYATQKDHLRMVPSQDEIDALGGGLKKEDWFRRFALIIEKARGLEVSMIIGVAQTMVAFGRFCKRFCGRYPKDLWRMSVLVATAAPGIATKYAVTLRALYGDVDVVEMYGATEGIFAQQLDEKPYVVPNFDGCFLEVETRRGMKMLHEMKRGERGSLIISTPLLPRYRIGDVIMCYGQPYFRCPGRERDFTPLRFAAESFINGDWQSLGVLFSS